MMRSLTPVTVAVSVTIQAAIIAFGGAAAAAPQQPQIETLPDAPGKELVEQVCATCHGVDLLVPSSRTATQWRDTMGAMKTAGAKASDEEWKTIVDYIMGNMAFLNVNKATVEDVRLVFGVPEKVAQAVVAARDKQGGFKTIDDLQQVPDLDQKRLDAIKARLTF
jgi:competence ComEA-like helix-hairpin-helix protein